MPDTDLAVNMRHMQANASSDDESMSEGSQQTVAHGAAQQWQVPPHVRPAQEAAQHQSEQAFLYPLPEQRLLSDPEASLEDAGGPVDFRLYDLASCLKAVQPALACLHLQVRCR